MTNILKHLEYLIPILVGMPNIVKILAGVWLIITLLLMVSISTISYQKNKQKALQEENYKVEVTKTQISRFIEDFHLSAQRIVEEFPKQVNDIKQKFNARGALDSSMYIRELYDTAIGYKEKIDTEYRCMTRKIEDILLKEFKNRNINEISTLGEERQKMEDLREYYETQKKRFEEPARKADLRLNKNNPIITEDFVMTKY